MRIVLSIFLNDPQQICCSGRKKIKKKKSQDTSITADDLHNNLATSILHTESYSTSIHRHA